MKAQTSALQEWPITTLAVHHELLVDPSINHRVWEVSATQILFSLGELQA
jgi:hypothetical protein